ncbi:MAG: M36 family metallopeptidase [Pirellulales bacterium]
MLGLESDLGELVHQKTILSLGARHVIWQQMHAGRRVHRAYVTVHVGNRGQIYLAKNRAVPRPLLPSKAEFRLGVNEAVRRARRRLPSAGRRATEQGTEELWFPKEERLVPAWRIRLARTSPREEWIVYINARTGGFLSRYDNLSKATGRGRVFDPSPVTALGDHDALLTAKGNHRIPPAPAYATVTLRDLKTNGRLEGKWVTTQPTRAGRRVRRRDRSFLFTSREKGFEEVMVYHHIDRAIRYIERLGFRGSRAIFGAPVRVDVNGTREDNSWYSPAEKLLTFGIGAIDDAEDGETILHEFGHAIQDAIVPDFGQSEEAAAMGEGFGDYFAASFFAETKPARYRSTVMTWDGLLIGLERGLDPPGLRRVDEDWTYDDFIEGDDEHDNGEIWSATLWDVRGKMGREEADRLILESHFQLDGFTTFPRGARAILDADENLNGGANRASLKEVFRKRRVRPV